MHMAFELQHVVLPPMKSKMVEIDIKSVGLCHRDTHDHDDDWRISNYPW